MESIVVEIILRALLWRFSDENSLARHRFVLEDGDVLLRGIFERFTHLK